STFHFPLCHSLERRESFMSTRKLCVLVMTLALLWPGRAAASKPADLPIDLTGKCQVPESSGPGGIEVIDEVASGQAALDLIQFLNQFSQRVDDPGDFPCLDSLTLSALWILADVCNQNSQNLDGQYGDESEAAPDEELVPDSQNSQNVEGVRVGQLVIVGNDVTADRVIL